MSSISCKDYLFNSYTVEVEVVYLRVAQGGEESTMGMLEPFLDFAHIDHRHGDDQELHVPQLERFRPAAEIGLELLHLGDVTVVPRLEEKLVHKDGNGAVRDVGLVAGRSRAVEELVGDVHAVREEGVVSEPRASDLTDVAQPGLEDVAKMGFAGLTKGFRISGRDGARPSRNVGIAYRWRNLGGPPAVAADLLCLSLGQPLANCLIPALDIFGELALDGHLDAGGDDHDVRHGRTAYGLAIIDGLGRKLEELERRRRVEIG